MATISVTFNDLLPFEAEALTSLGSLLKQTEDVDELDLMIASRGVVYILDCVTEAISDSHYFAGLVTFPLDDEAGDIVTGSGRLAAVYRACSLAATELRSMHERNRLSSGAPE